MWFIILVVVTVVNAAVGGWYYLRIAAVMYLRTPLHPRRSGRGSGRRWSRCGCAPW